MLDAIAITLACINKIQRKAFNIEVTVLKKQGVEFSQRNSNEIVKTKDLEIRGEKISLLTEGEYECEADKNRKIRSTTFDKNDNYKSN